MYFVHLTTTPDYWIHYYFNHALVTVNGNNSELSHITATEITSFSLHANTALHPSEYHLPPCFVYDFPLQGEISHVFH
jgi:hypothetical protein